MNVEIKEIEIWKEKTKGIFHITEYTRFWNYITNLQEENRILKELNVCVGCNNNPDYKSRIDKAIEYIEIWHYRNDYRVNSFTRECKNDLLNILQGEDKE